MKRVLASVIIVATAVVGLSACSNSPAPEKEAETATSAVTEEVVEEEPAKEEEADVSVAEACVSLAEPLADATAEIAEVAQQTSTDPEAAVEAWRILSTTFEDLGKTAANADVAGLATAVGEDAHALTDSIQKVFVDQDLAAMEDYTEATTAFTETYEELLTLCGNAQ